jgi:PAS domain S-box-containing protein
MTATAPRRAGPTRPLRSPGVSRPGGPAGKGPLTSASALAARPGGNPVRTLAVLAPFVGGFYFGNVLHGAARAAAAGGHALMAVQTSPAGLDLGEYCGPFLEKFQESVTQLGALRLTSRGMSGLIVIGNAVHPDDLERLHRQGRPLVLVSGEEAQWPVPVALPDNFGGIRAAVDHLVGHGHRTIGFVAYLEQRDMVERLQAYRQALIDNGITPRPEWVTEVPNTVESGGQVGARRLLAAGVPTTAQIIATDRQAIGFIAELTAAGLKLPAQQAIIGFDNTEAGARSNPRLSSVEPHFDRVGELAVRMLLDPRRAAGRVRSTTSLVIRESCGCTPSITAGRPTAGSGPASPAAEAVYLRRQGQLEASISAQVEIGMELMRPGRIDPRRLEWLGASRVTAGCLALWTDDDPEAGTDRRMRITGVHDRSEANGSLNKLIGANIVLGDFPPVALKELCPPGSAEAVIVLPVTTERREWGLLALVGSLEHRARSVRDDYNHWATLLGVALEQDELLRSEQAQRADLERSYRRERDLVDSVRASEERYALIARATNDGVWDWDVSAGTVYYSPRWKAMLGYEDAEIGRTPGEWLDRVHPDDRKELSAAIAAQLGGASAPLEVRHRIRTRSGDHRWVLCRALTVVDDAGCPSRVVGVLIDLSEQKALEEQLRRGALHDPVTRLPNPALFLDRLGTALVRARRTPGYDFALLVLRVDGADEAAGAAGEEVLRGLLPVLEAALDELDTVGRLGPAELAVLLDDVRERDVETLTARLEAALNRALTAGRLSCGLATDCSHLASPDDVLREADIAVHRAQARAARRQAS